MREGHGTESWTEKKKRKKRAVVVFCDLSATEVKSCEISLIHYPVQYIHG